MKKLLCVVSLIAAIGVGVVHAQSDSMDLVVLVDTSASMFPYWHDTTDYLIRNIVAGVLRKGDSFHLVSFASRPEVEISRTIETQKDVQAILARFLLLAPLGRYTDLVSAIDYLHHYVSTLPPASQKEIIILTDGIDDPPPDSIYPIDGKANIQRDEQVLLGAARRMRAEGWKIRIIQYPIAGAPVSGPPQPGVQLLGGTEGAAASRTRPGAASPSSSTASPQSSSSSGTSTTARQPSATAPTPAVGQPAAPGARAAGPQAAGQAPSTAAPAGSPEGKAPLLGALAKGLGVPIQQYNSLKKENLASAATGAPSVGFPGNLGTIGYDATVPFAIKNFQNHPIDVRLSGIIYGGANILRRPVSLTVGASGEATLEAPIALPRTLAAGPHAIPVSLQFSDTLRESPRTGTLSFTLRATSAVNVSPYLLPILIGIVALILVLLVIFFIRRIIANLRAAPSVAPRVHFETPTMGIHPIELRVSGQNPNIGARNIHPIGRGTRRAVGGGGSAFLIYLYPCPPHVGEISREGENYIFVPLKPEYFPGMAGEMRDCLGKEIRVRLAEKHDVTITFRRYVSPLDEINRIMHLVDKPGTPSREST